MGERPAIRPNARQVAATGHDGRLPDDDLQAILARAGIVALRAISKADRLAAIRLVTPDAHDSLAALDALDRLGPALMKW